MGIGKLDVTELRDAFSSMSVSELSDYKFLSSFIFNKCGLIFSKFIKINYPDPSKLNCWRGVNSKQYPDELAKLLVFIYRNKFEINSYCEIGIERGGTFCIIDSFLRSVNPNMGESMGIECRLSDRRRFFIDKYVNNCPEAKYKIINSSQFRPSKKYDLCFLDGDHSYAGAKSDFELMKPFSKYIAMHAIHLNITNNGARSVRELWSDLDGDKIEFLNEDDLFPIPVGIGLWKKVAE